MGSFSYGLYIKLIIKVTAGWVTKDQVSSESSLEEKRLKTLSLHPCRESRSDLKVFFVNLFSENLI